MYFDTGVGPFRHGNRFWSVGVERTVLYPYVVRSLLSSFSTRTVDTDVSPNKTEHPDQLLKVKNCNTRG